MFSQKSYINESDKIARDEQKIKMYNYPFKNIVIAGCGAGVVAIGGTLKVLDQKNILCNLEKYAGSSSGALVSTLLCIGYTGAEIAEILVDSELSQFLDNDWGVGLDIHNVARKYGAYKGDAFLSFVKRLIQKKLRKIHNVNSQKLRNKKYKKLNNERHQKIKSENIQKNRREIFQIQKSTDVTFEELYQITNRELVLVTTNLSKDCAMYLSRHKTPNMSVARAVRASMSFPFIYKPVALHDNISDTHDYLCDGGISDNYPIGIFDKKYNGKTKINYETLGIKFISSGDTKHKRIRHPVEISNVFTYMSQIYTHVVKKIEYQSIGRGYHERTMIVPIEYIGLLDFRLSKYTKNTLQNNAENSATLQLDIYNIYKIFQNTQ